MTVIFVVVVVILHGDDVDCFVDSGKTYPEKSRKNTRRRPEFYWPMPTRSPTNRSSARPCRLRAEIRGACLQTLRSLQQVGCDWWSKNDQIVCSRFIWQ